MEWISVEDQLPELPQDVPEWQARVRVIAAWGPEEGNVSEMSYERRLVRNARVSRFHYQGRISPWKVTHWMLLPAPPPTKH